MSYGLQPRAVGSSSCSNQRPSSATTRHSPATRAQGYRSGACCGRLQHVKVGSRCGSTCGCRCGCRCGSRCGCTCGSRCGSRCGCRCGCRAGRAVGREGLDLVPEEVTATAHLVWHRGTGARWRWCAQWHWYALAQVCTVARVCTVAMVCALVVWRTACTRQQRVVLVRPGCNSASDLRRIACYSYTLQQPTKPYAARRRTSPRCRFVSSSSSTSTSISPPAAWVLGGAECAGAALARAGGGAVKRRWGLGGEGSPRACAEPPAHTVPAAVDVQGAHAGSSVSDRSTAAELARSQQRTACDRPVLTGQCRQWPHCVRPAWRRSAACGTAESSGRHQ